MGDCYKYKKYISDYIEKKLDPLTNKSVEEHLVECPKCKSIVQQLPLMQSTLSELPNYQCSEDFMVKLHQRIHSRSKSARIPITIMKFPKTVKQYSFALSIVLLAFFVVFGINNIFNDESSDSVLPTVNEIQKVAPISTSRGGSSTPTTGSNTFIDQKEHEIRTKDSQTASSDSANAQKGPEEKPRIKYVDQTK